MESGQKIYGRFRLWKRTWKVDKRTMECLDCGKGHGKWTISTVPHTIQDDSVNCGIFVMKV
jgi:hypothetical protein